MKKNWLIRTKNNHILGPVSKDKIKELLKNGSIKGDDEVCSANGFWMYVRETELLDQYVFGDEIQSFNPVQEAQPCQISDFPPDLNLLKVQPEPTGPNHQLASTSVQTNPLLPQNQENLTDRPVEELAVNEDGSDSLPDNKKKSTKRIIKTRNLRTIKSKPKPVKTLLNKKVLYLLMFVFLLILIFSLFKKELIIDQLKKLSAISLIPNVHAQSVKPEKKKTITFQKF